MTLTNHHDGPLHMNSETLAPNAADTANANANADVALRRRDRRAALVVVLALFGVYLLTMGGHSYSVDGETYLAGTRALMHHTTVLDPGPDIDAVVIRVVNKNGGWTTAAPIGTLLLFTPGAVVGSAVAHVFSGPSREEIFRLFYFSANGLMTALTAGVLVLLCRRLGASLRSAVLLAVVFGLGTWAWGHGQTDFSEPGTALMLTTAALCSVRWWKAPTFRNAALVGFWAGCVGITRSSTLLFIPVFLIAGLVGNGENAQSRLRSCGAFALGGVIPGLLFAANSWLRFGSLLDSGYPPMSYPTPVHEGLFGLFLSSGKGLIWYAPVCVVSLFAVRQSYLANKRYAVTIAVVLAAHLAVYSRFFMWSGDNAYGPRYMVPVLPLLVALIAPVIDSGRHWGRGVKVAGIVGFLVPGVMGTLMYFNGVYYNQQPHVASDFGMTEMTSVQQNIAWDFVPRTSPLTLSVHSLPALARNTRDRLDGKPGGFTPIPSNYEERIHWYARAIELDTWWSWWSFRGDPAGAYALLLVPLACFAAAGSLGLRLLPRRSRLTT